MSADQFLILDQDWQRVIISCDVRIFKHFTMDAPWILHGMESLITLVERTSKLTCIIKAPDRKAATINELISKRMKKFSISSVTFDNGKEFAMYESIASELDCDIYFAHPYRSWERGLNENTMV